MSRKSDLGGMDHLRAPRILRSGSAMVLDDTTRRNLELVESMRSGVERRLFPLDGGAAGLVWEAQKAARAKEKMEEKKAA